MGRPPSATTGVANLVSPDQRRLTMRKKLRKKASKYPPYPGTNWDYGAKMAAGQCLIPPNKKICIYCRGQCKTGETVPHQPDCPARNDEE
jgi:hypothetical protein